MIPLTKFLIKCLCTPIMISIGLLYFIVGLITWQEKFGTRGTETFDELWDNK
jgi:hypothetical protein